MRGYTQHPRDPDSSLKHSKARDVDRLTVKPGILIVVFLEITFLIATDYG